MVTVGHYKTSGEYFAVEGPPPEDACECALRFSDVDEAVAQVKGFDNALVMKLAALEDEVAHTKETIMANSELLAKIRELKEVK